MHSEAYRKSIAVKRGSHNPHPALPLCLYLTPHAPSSHRFMLFPLSIFAHLPLLPSALTPSVCTSNLVLFCASVPSVSPPPPRRFRPHLPPLLCRPRLSLSSFQDALLLQAAGTLQLEQQSLWTPLCIYTTHRTHHRICAGIRKAWLGVKVGMVLGWVRTLTCFFAAAGTGQQPDTRVHH